jgi:rhodanese-related sulfurtransferase
MRNLLFVVLALGAGACTKPDTNSRETAQQAAVAAVTVDQLDSSLANNESQPVDANGEQTRKRMGVIPGAVLLSDSDSFKVTELPADKAKSLVFYCANTECGASHHAAEKAITAGYTNVKVLPAGIAGWVKAGKKTQSI